MYRSETLTAPNKLVYFNDHSFVGDGRYEFKMRGHPTMAPPIKGTDFYKKHNPTKMADVPKLLKKFEGREEAMFQALEEKYASEVIKFL